MASYKDVINGLLGGGNASGGSQTGYEDVLNQLLQSQGQEYQPQERELPEGAQDFLPMSRQIMPDGFEGQGEAYYGPGLEGYFAGKSARINAKAYVKNDDGTYSESDPNAFQKISRTVGEGVGTVLDIFGLPAKGVKAVLGVGLANETLADSAASPLPDLLKGEEWYHVLGAATPLFQLYNQVRMLTGERDISVSERLQEMDKQVQASRIMYSAWADPALRAEFIRRAEAGENPDYLAAELENPWYEMAGEFVLDPLNVVDALAKTGATVSKIAKASESFATAIPEAENAVSALRAARMGAESGIDIATESAKIAEKVAGIEAGISKLEGYASAWQAPLYTATAKRSFIGETVGNVGRILMGSFQQAPDEAAEAIRALALIGSKNPDEVQEAMGILRNLPVDIGKVAFSKAGIETGIILRKAMTSAGDFKPEKFLDLIRNADYAKLEDVFNNKIVGVLEDVFPTVDQALAKNEKTQAAIDALRAAGKDLEADAKAAELIKVSEGAKRVNQIHNFAQKNLKLKAFHSGMSTVYISMQPGVGVRNVLGGLTHIAADLGPGAAFKAAGAAGEAAAGMAKGKNLEASVGAFGLIRKWMGGGMIEAALRGVGGGLEDASGPIKNLMSAGEQAMSAAIVADVVETTMRRALKSSFAELAPEMSRAFGDNGAKRLMALVTANQGDWDTAIALFRKEKATGIIESWRNLKDWMNPNEYKKLAGGKILGEVEAAIAGADDLAGAERKLDEIVKRYIKRAATTVDDPPGEVLDEFIQEAGEHIPPAELTAFNLKRISYENAKNAFIGAADSYLNDAVSRLARAGDTQGMEFINGLRSNFTKAHIEAGKQTAARTGAMRDFIRKIDALVVSGDNKKAWQLLSANQEVYGDMWKSVLKLPTAPPTDTKAFRSLLWETIYKGQSDTLWRMERDRMAELAMNQAGQVAQVMGENLADNEMFRVATSQLLYSDIVARAKYIPGKGLFADGVEMAGDTPGALRSLASRLGISTVSEAGVPADQRLLNTINKYLPEGAEKFAKIEDVPFDAGQAALRKWAGDEKFMAASSLGERIPIPRANDSDEMFSAGQIAAANLEGVQQAVNRVKSQLRTVWGKGEIVERLDGIGEQALQSVSSLGKQHVIEARLVAADVATKARDFALINYGRKTTLDLAAAYVMPFQYWYSRTYPNWLKRLATAPGTVAAYAKYRDAIEKAHANLPDWWKYNISTDDIPGLDLANPLFFNLEATLNPLNGLTGVDFTDSEKVVGENGSAMRAWTSSLDALGKFGPAPHTLLTLGTAFGLYMNGQKDAASRWAGRLIPQTASVKAASAKLGMAPVELDPSVWLFSGGIDAYERRRVGRAMGALIQENPGIEAEAIEAMRTQSGPLWDEAYRRSTAERADATLGSFMFGVGLKGRTEQDLAIDQFYADYRNLWAQRDNMSPEEFGEAMNSIKDQYPFMDAVLLSKKDGIDRDRAYAYTVINRIPPGTFSDVSTAVGLDPRIVEKFYATKGAFDKWPETDRARFMAAMVDIGAMLDIPDNATRDEWTAVRSEYAAMNRRAEAMFGAGVWDKVSTWYDIPTRAGQDDYLRQHPEIQQALDFKAGSVAGSPLLSAYYDGVAQLDKYYQGKMRTEAEQMFGADFWKELDAYYVNRDAMPSKEFSAWQKQHPNIKRYFELRDKWDVAINRKLDEFSRRIPEAKAFQLREAQGEMSIGAQDITTYAEQQPLQWRDVQGDIPTDLQDALSAYYESGTNLSFANRTRLEQIAKRLGISVDELILLAGQQ